VIPKRHARDIWEIEPAEFAAVARSAQRMAVRVRDRLAPDGVNLINSCGAAGWQTVFHLHVHVIPRYVGDGLQTPFAPVDAGSDGLAEVAAQLR
jgi:histidine triad (HIT) family protein